MLTRSYEEALKKGRIAHRDGLGERDCPHADTFDPELGFWDSPMGLRQAWLKGLYEVLSRKTL